MAIVNVTDTKRYTNVVEYAGGTMTAVNEAIIEKFRDAGISIPFPQRDINVVPNQSDVLDT